MKGLALKPPRAAGNFFVRYKDLHARLSRHLGENGYIVAHEGLPGYQAGNLLAQVAFLYFLREKGWFSIPDDLHHVNYYNEVIKPLCNKLRFLDKDMHDLDVPNYFLRDHGTGVMDVFDEYYFTVREDGLPKGQRMITPEILGEAFEILLETSERKHKGVFYTPPEIVQYMCRESLAYYLDGELSPDEQDEKLFNIKICDPAVGSGAFAVAMLRELVNAQQKLLSQLSDAYLEKKLQRLGLSKTSLEQNDHAYSFHISLHAIQECIYGLDIDAAAIDRARLRLWLVLVAEESCFHSLAELPTPEFRIIQGNALTALPSHWQKQFDIVIGNPPYGIYQGIRKDELDIIKKMPHFGLAKGQKLNAFELFLCIAPLLCKPVNGIISMIFQNSFLADTSSKLLRQFYLQHKQVIRIDSFPERDDHHKRVFSAAKMSVCILFARNGHNFNYSFDLNIWEDRYFTGGTTARIFADDIFKFDPKYYSIPSVSDDEYKVLQHLGEFQKLYTIAHCFEGEINLTTHKPYLSVQPLEGYHKMIKGAAIHRWRLVNKMSQGINEYVSPQYLNDCFTAAKSGHYRFPRLVLQGITGVDERHRLKFALLCSGTFCGNSANYLLFNDQSLAIPYLGILNSELQNWYFKKYSTNSNVNGYEIDNLPVVPLSPTEAGLLSSIAAYLTSIAGIEVLYEQFTFFDHLNNAVCYELYFKDEFNRENISFLQHLGLHPLSDNMTQEQKLQIIQSEFIRVSQTINLELLENVSSVRIIRSALSR